MQSSGQTKPPADREAHRREKEAQLEAQEEMELRKKGENGTDPRTAGIYVPPAKVERKFLVGQVPKILGLRDGLRISQGYLAVEKDGSEVRMRKTEKGSSLFVKNAAGKQQVEVEVPLTPEQVKALWPLTEGRRMSKVTYQVDVAETPFTLDMYEGQLSWLHIAEAEFPGPTAAEAFTPPAWFSREVSELPAYRHSNLARE